MVAPFRGNVFGVKFPHDFIRCIGNRDVELLFEGADVKPKELLLLRDLAAGLDRIVDEVSENDAEVQVADGKILRNHGLVITGDAVLQGQRNLGVQYCVRIEVSGVEKEADVVEVRFQLIEMLSPAW